MIVAIVPALNSEDTVAATVHALGSIAQVESVVVVDDGSSDATAEMARNAGADVVVLDENRGKGGAVSAGVRAIDGVEVVLLVDADTGDTAKAAAALIGPVVDRSAAMTVAVVPDAAGRGGFGLVVGVAREALLRATGQKFAAPLSGQRAIRKEVLDQVELAPRFGLEVGLTLDVCELNEVVVEVEAAFDHRHTGRNLAGFLHRLGQGKDLVRALAGRVGLRRTASSVVVSLWKRVRP